MLGGLGGVDQMLLVGIPDDRGLLQYRADKNFVAGHL